VSTVIHTPSRGVIVSSGKRGRAVRLPSTGHHAIRGTDHRLPGRGPPLRCCGVGALVAVRSGRPAGRRAGTTRRYRPRASRVRGVGADRGVGAGDRVGPGIGGGRGRCDVDRLGGHRGVPGGHCAPACRAPWRRWKPVESPCPRPGSSMPRRCTCPTSTPPRSSVRCWSRPGLRLPGRSAPRPAERCSRLTPLPPRAGPTAPAVTEPVRMWPEPDAMATLPATDAVGVFAVLDEHARPRRIPRRRAQHGRPPR
jgi:hypothetical protein